MITSYPAPMAPAESARRVERVSFPKPPATAASGSWRYEGRQRLRNIIVVAAIISAGLHAGLLFGFGHAKKKPAPPKAERVIALTLAIPEIKDLEKPEPVPNEDAGRAEESFVPVPMQADLPQLPQPSDFVEQIDFSSLIDRPDFSKAKLFSIPENIRRGGKIAEGLGNIFNLADLDREPVPVFQAAPAVPAQLRREGISGTVRLEFVVNAEGRVMNAVVVESTDSRFNEAAIAGVSKWKFKPGMKDGRKVNTQVAVPIVFTIAECID